MQLGSLFDIFEYLLVKRMQGYHSEREQDMCTTNCDSLCWLVHAGFQIECDPSIKINPVHVSNWNTDLPFKPCKDYQQKESVSDGTSLKVSSWFLCVKRFPNWLGHFDFWQVQNRKQRPSWPCALRQPSAIIWTTTVLLSSSSRGSAASFIL